MKAILCALLALLSGSPMALTASQSAVYPDEVSICECSGILPAVTVEDVTTGVETVRTMYNFRSEETNTYWTLSAEELGFIPDVGADYCIVWSSNGTVSEVDMHDGAPVDGCECHVYDDIFIYAVKVSEQKNKHL